MEAVLTPLPGWEGDLDNPRLDFAGWQPTHLSPPPQSSPIKGEEGSCLGCGGRMEAVLTPVPGWEGDLDNPRLDFAGWQPTRLSPPPQSSPIKGEEGSCLGCGGRMEAVLTPFPGWQGDLDNPRLDFVGWQPTRLSPPPQSSPIKGEEGSGGLAAALGSRRKLMARAGRRARTGFASPAWPRLPH